MAVAVLNDRQRVAPAAAANVTLTPSGSAWTSSAWVQLTASVASASVLTGIVAATDWGDGASVTASWEIDIGTGAAASEVVIATFNGTLRGLFGQQPDTMLWIPSVVGIDNIANGARLAARIRTSATAVNTWSCAATYAHKPLSGTILTTAQPLLPIPPQTAAVSLTAGGSAWTSGSWAQLRAASGAALVVVGVAFSAGATDVEYELDLGTGAAASEVVITTIRLVGNASMAVFGNVPQWVPLDNIAASTRVAARLRASTGSSTGRVNLLVIEKPL